MKRAFTATVWREGNWYVSQCLELDIASQGESEQAAVANLKDALELHFEPPRPREYRKFAPSRLRLARLNPLPFNEIKRRLETAGFVEATQKEAMSSSFGAPAKLSILQLCQGNIRSLGTLRSILSQAHIGLAEWETLG